MTRPSKKECKFLVEAFMAIQLQSTQLLAMIRTGKNQNKTYRGLFEVFSQEQFNGYIAALAKIVPKYVQVAKILERIDEKAKKRAGVREIVTQLLTQSKSSKVGDLTILPVQRFPRFIMLLKDLEKRHSNDHPVKVRLNEIILRLEQAGEMINAAAS